MSKFAFKRVISIASNHWHGGVTLEFVNNYLVDSKLANGEHSELVQFELSDIRASYSWELLDLLLRC